MKNEDVEYNRLQRLAQQRREHEMDDELNKLSDERHKIRLKRDDDQQAFSDLLHELESKKEKEIRARIEKDQIRRASVSVPSNISEGYERDSKKQFLYFLVIAKGSCGEVRSQLYRVADRNHITSGEFENLKAQTEDISKQLKGFISYLNTSEFKGTKFK